jgi:hypothetical protein
VSTIAPLAGSRPEGADTFSVEPSAAAVDDEAVVGEVGVEEELLQPASTSRGISAATDRDIDGVAERIVLQREADVADDSAVLALSSTPPAPDRGTRSEPC